MALRPEVRCKKCGEHYPNTDRLGHCSSCCRTIVGIKTFDTHRTGKPGIRHCSTDAALIERGYWQDGRGHWHNSGRMTDDEKARVKAAGK